MKTFTFLRVILPLLLLASARSNAQVQFSEDPGLTPNPCYNLQNCSLEQRDIWAEYTRALPLKNKAAQEAVFTGECFHSSDQFENNVRHYGLAYLKPTPKGLHYAGRFSFFYTADPYAEIDLEQARLEFPEIEQKRFRLQQSEDFSFIDFNPSQTPIWQYYLRLSEDEQNLFVIGFWGTSHQLLCRLRNQPLPTVQP